MEEYVDDYDLILKMDCEGGEYRILKELLDKGILDRFTFIMLEWHYKGKEAILHYLLEAGMSYWCCDKDDQMGLIYAFKA